jgi:hypothetical protein
MFRPIFFFFILLIISCNGGKKSSREDSSLKKITDEAVLIAETYAQGQLKTAKESVSKDGSIKITDDLKSYVIYPSRIIVGLIDDDSEMDAIVPVEIYNGQDLNRIEQLILLNTNGKLMLIKDIDTDLIILGLNNRVITAEIHKHSRNSPLYNCKSCKEIVRFQYKEGELIRME